MKSLHLEDAQVITLLELVEESIKVYTKTLTYDTMLIYEKDLKQQMEKRIENLIKLKNILEFGK